MTTNQASSTDVVVTARAIMNILQDDQEQSLEDAFQTEMRNEMTTERAEAFLEDAAFEIEPVEKFKKDPAPKDKTLDIQFTPDGISTLGEKPPPSRSERSERVGWG